MKSDGITPVEILRVLMEIKPSVSPEPDFDDEDSGIEDCSSPANPAEDPHLNSQIRSLIRHPLFRKFYLTRRDVLVIADLWRQQLEQPGRSASWINICDSAKLPLFRVPECLKYLSGLLERGIICFDEAIQGDYLLNPLILPTARYFLSKDISLRILGRDLRLELGLTLQDVWHTDADFVGDLRRMLDMCYHSFGEHSNRTLMLEYPILSQCFSILRQRIQSAPETLGIKTLMRKHKLSSMQMDILMLTLYHQLGGEDKITEADLLLSLMPDPRRRQKVLQLISDTSKLVSSGLITREDRYYRTHCTCLAIPPEISTVMGYQARRTEKPKPKKLSSFFVKSQPKQTMQDLIIPDADKALLLHIISKCRTEYRSDLEQWGFGTGAAREGAVILLYGAPGTGKTFTAGAIANELHRQLVLLNVPELRDKYYGETEKLIKRSFTEMREMAQDGDAAPVFLLNEADQLIHSRVSADTSCERTENTVQNIILEELETFPGILILTTNLESNMDEAFFRRFDLKFRFQLPDLKSRRQLWKLYLKRDIPGSGEVDVEVLAQRYHFSGAQIALVVKNACIEAIGRKGVDKKIYLNDLLKYAELEHPWAGRYGKSIGF